VGAAEAALPLRARWHVRDYAAAAAAHDAAEDVAAEAGAVGRAAERAADVAAAKVGLYTWNPAL
jgi:hypothetical protein